MFFATFLLFSSLFRSRRTAITRFVIEVRGCGRRQGGDFGFFRDTVILQHGRSFTCRGTFGDNQRIEITVTSF